VTVPTTHRQSTSTDSQRAASDSATLNGNQAGHQVGETTPTAAKYTSSIVTLNINGLYSNKYKDKLKFLQDLSVGENTKIIALSETHLKSSITDAEIKIDKFVPFRTDRAGQRKKGGVATYVAEQLAANVDVLESKSNEFCELLIVYIKTQNLVFANVYRPPECPRDKFLDVLTAVENSIEKFKSPTPNIVLTGDFNFPIIDWENHSICAGRLECREQARSLLNFVENHCLQQCVDVPTRGANILDLFFTNNDQLVCDIIVTDSAISDHKLVLTNTNISFENSNDYQVPKKRDEYTERSFRTLNFFSKSVKWSEIKVDLKAINWHEKFQNKSTDAIFSLFTNIIRDICIKSVPKRTPSKTSNIPRDRKILMRKRKKLSKKLRTQTTQSQIEINHKIKLIESQLLDSYNNENELKETLAVSAIKTNPKYFYSYAKNKATIRAKIGPLVQDGNSVSEPRDIAETLNKQYQSAFSTPSTSHRVENVSNFFTVDSHEQQFHELNFSPENILEAIKTIPSNSAAGPDNFPAILLKTCAEELSVPLHLLWRTSLETGIIPSELKKATITPIYKGGPRNAPKNYRPVALTSHIVKVFEKVLVKNLTKHLENQNLMNDNQHGFRANRSCLSQLLSHYECVLNALESNENVDVIYLDFAKAFDKVDHGILMHKLKKVNVSGKVGVWINNFLTNRTQQVTVEGQLSSQSKVISGVPQGTVLGPLLFLILISDIDKDITASTVSSFADDTRVLKEIKTRYQFRENSGVAFEYESNDGNKIAVKSHLRDLGVTISNNAGFESHIAQAVQKSRMKVGWILRTFKTRQLLPMMTLWKSLVLPLLDYCSQLWCPSKKGEVLSIESVQRSFTSKITEIEHLNYWERLEKLQLFSLERRRERYLIIYVWKMISNMVPNIGLTTKHHPRTGRTCEIKKIQTKSMKRVQTIRESSIKVKGSKLFNLLPKGIRNLENVSVDVFKHRLDVYLKTVPDQPNIPHYHQRAASNSLIDQLEVIRADAARSVANHGDPVLHSL